MSSKNRTRCSYLKPLNISKIKINNTWTTNNNIRLELPEILLIWRKRKKGKILYDNFLIKSSTFRHLASAILQQWFTHIKWQKIPKLLYTMYYIVLGILLWTTTEDKWATTIPLVTMFTDIVDGITMLPDIVLQFIHKKYVNIPAHLMHILPYLSKRISIAIKICLVKIKIILNGIAKVTDSAAKIVNGKQRFGVDLHRFLTLPQVGNFYCCWTCIGFYFQRNTTALFRYFIWFFWS